MCAKLVLFVNHCCYSVCSMSRSSCWLFLQCLFMLLLLLIAKGWTITSHRLDAFSKLLLFTVWSAYSAASVALFLWNQVITAAYYFKLCYSSNYCHVLLLSL